ncbi:MAG: PQQ-binding-like beta-propeller repeat protein [Planctomycetota bacterium]|nr:PQQ-binding-like beta-propeller repeat protein [Planctomycetota bacterium]
MRIVLLSENGRGENGRGERIRLRRLLPSWTALLTSHVSLLPLSLNVALLASSLSAADWPQFRGPAATGATDEANPPVEWSADKNVAWIAELPGVGFSQPVIVGETVYVTSSSGPSNERLHVSCFDATSGKPRWHRQFWATGRTVVNQEMRVATPTPVATAERVYAFFSSNDLICLDADGNLLWYRGLMYDYPNATNSLGMASSPVLTRDTLVCQLETDDASFAIGLDADTGENRWKIDRFRKANWTSPVVFNSDDGPLVLLEGAKDVTAVEPTSGKTAWSFAGGGSTLSSVVAADGIVFVPNNGVTAIRPPAGGSSPETLWRTPKLNCSFVSPVVYHGRVYTINGSGVLNCGDAKTGEVLWQMRLGGSYWGTPSAADGRLYCPTREGVVKVVDVSGEKGEILAENEIGEPLSCPPALADNALYIRTDTKLWKVAAP